MKILQTLTLPLVAALACCFPSAARAGLKVATLHPLLNDLAANVGGPEVEVVGLMKPGGDPHTFDPSPGDLARIRDARLVLAMGKGLEAFLPRLRDNLASGQELFEVGRKLPSLKVEVGELFVCCPTHSHGAIDPHWWHSVSNMKRAARDLAEEFGRVDPANADLYAANAKAYGAKLNELDSWVRRELAAIARADRELATAHAAFTYFCKGYGFRALPVKGLNRESDPSPSYLAETIETLKREKVRAVFPEQIANPKVLQAMVSAAGVRLGGELVADGTGTGTSATFEGMMRHNVSTITSALR